MKIIILFIFGTLFFVIPNLSAAEFHGTLTATSNYASRGYTKSDNEFAVQANIDYEHETGGYVGVSTSTVNFGDKDLDNRASVEIIPYLGWSFDLSDDWRLDLQWSRYLYDGNVFGKTPDYNEFYLFLHYRDLLSASISGSEDYYNRGKHAENYELTGRYPVTDFLQISSSVGYSYTKKAVEDNYAYWSAGFTLFYKFAALDFRYIDAYEEEHHDEFQTHDQFLYDPELIKPSFLFTVSIGF